MARPNSKTEKKIDKNVCLALTKACEHFLESINGFQWVTHQATYSDFPGSLFITCVFDSHENQKKAGDNDDNIRMSKIIQSELLKIGVKLKAPRLQIIYDSEERCNSEHDGNWAQRLASREKRSVTHTRANSN
ncbi:MAG: hypothetical protein ACI92E_000726 [Oceanicoccus sp.]|jgi:hypothetical protein